MTPEARAGALSSVVLRRTVTLAEIPAPTAASTDANAARAASMPAIAIGVTTGGGEHTPHEWIDTSPLGAGLGCAAATIAGWEGVGCDQP